MSDENKPVVTGMRVCPECTENVKQIIADIIKSVPKGTTLETCVSEVLPPQNALLLDAFLVGIAFAEHAHVQRTNAEGVPDGTTRH